MTRRALLLGATAPNLDGVEHDIELMQAALTYHGFAPEHLDVVVPATRAAIEAGVERLLEAVEPGDAVVLYYSGHGSKLDADPRDRSAQVPLGEASYHRFLVASDFEESTDEDFRGYTSAELSLDLAALTRVTPNVIAIMDCCFAGRIFRASEDEQRERLVWADGSSGPPARHVGIDGPWARHAQRHYDRLRQTRGLELDRRAAEANPHAIRLLASSASKPAFETPRPPRAEADWRPAGVMTRALHDILMRVDAERTTWQQLGRHIYMTPQRGTLQRVSIEGPYRRLLFSLVEREELGEVDLSLERAPPTLTGGWVADIAVGDRFELRMPDDRGEPRSVGTARVRALTSSHAELAASGSLDVDALGPGACARPLTYARPRAAIEIAGLDPASPGFALLDARLSASGYLDPIPAGAETSAPIAGRIRHAQGKLQLLADEVALERARSFAPAGSPACAELLVEHLNDACHRVARAMQLRRLARAPIPAGEDLDPGAALSLFTVESGRKGRELADGDVLRSGAAISLALQTPTTLFINALLVDPDAKISLLTRSQQSGGVEVAAREGYVLGQRSGDPDARLRGVELTRPSPSIIADPGPLPLTLVVILSDGPLDLRRWQQRGISRFAPRDALAAPRRYRNITPPPPPLNSARVHVTAHQLSLQTQDHPS